VHNDVVQHQDRGDISDPVAAYDPDFPIAHRFAWRVRNAYAIGNELAGRSRTQIADVMTAAEIHRRCHEATKDFDEPLVGRRYRKRVIC
jgi:hypothetical protein